MGLFEHFPYTNFQDLNLNTLLDKMRNLLAAMKELQDLVGGYEVRIRTLEAFMRRMETGDFDKAFLDSLYEWLTKNVPDILSSVIKQVWFGLTDTGYFCAYIPDSWQDIIFKTTGYDIELALQPEYGHLVLMTNVTPAVIGG